MIYFLHISYNGTHFKGWQWQADVRTVQGEMESCLQGIFKQDITVFGCGRTDTGVHASQYICHIEVANPIDFELAFRMNKFLPKDIVVHEVLSMQDGQHARYDALARTYDYYIHLYNDPFLDAFSSCYEIKNIDFEAMRSAVEILPRFTDFSVFCRLPHLYKHTLCKISHVRLYVNESQNRIRLTITADRFLRGMIRLIISFLLKIGEGKMTLKEFELMLSTQVQPTEKPAALPNGLYLSGVEYPYLKLTQSNDFCSFLNHGLEG